MYIKTPLFSVEWSIVLVPHTGSLLASTLLEPEMYVRYVSIRLFLLDKVQPTCGAWHVCALNQSITTDGEAHFNYSDYYYELNAVMRWGDYTAAKLILWQLGLAVKNKPGDAILFLGRILIHNSVDIQGGARSMLDCFTHQAPLIWKDRKHQELTELGRKGKPGAERKGKGKQRNTDSMDNIGDAKSEDLDTDEELGAMYTLRLWEMEGEDSVTVVVVVELLTAGARGLSRAPHVTHTRTFLFCILARQKNTSNTINSSSDKSAVLFRILFTVTDSD
ncbi:MAG: hypothetical protein M1839_001274 [Geoglossum umbratile]|nr:MAG: hypothetical protein M1839_001274 [Geoglossum umbratile]